MSTGRPAIFSAIILNYNHSRYVLSPLNAAIGQTHPFDEIIIIDDASTDASVALIEERIRDVPHARLIQNRQNLGVIGSANLGLQQAKGDFIFYMAADDDYSPHIVEWCQAALQNYPQAAMISGNTKIHHANTGKERVFNLPFPQKIGCYGRADIEAIAKHRAFTFNIGANAIRRDAILAAGQLISVLRWHSDWFLYLLIAGRSPFVVVPYEFVKVRQAGEQYSSACFNWTQQRPVIEAFILTLQRDYPDDYGFFRDCALLPTYDLQSLLLLALNPTLRDYLTPLLVWRLLTYKFFRVLSRLCPDKARAAIRKLVHV